MRQCLDFFKNKIQFFATITFTIGVYGAIFVFADLPREYFYLGMKILVFVGILYLFAAWLSYRKQETLSDAVERLSQENRMLKNQMLEDREDLTEYFLLWVHQIKNPITVANLILRKDSSEQTKQIREQMFYIESYTNMALNYLKLTDRCADMDIAEIPLDGVLNPLFKKYAMLFIEKRISLQYEPIAQTVTSDGKWLSILVEQILANAIKYTEKGKITIRFDRKKNALVIADTGIGIHSEDMKKIFDRGYSGFNGRLNEKSSGLGLYLVKKIGEMIAVNVEVLSTVGQGSTFFICFPSNLTNL